MLSSQAMFSIIIPIYNVEQYLDECISSVISQTFENIEVILVDDGSPDNCPGICDTYAEKDKRVKVIHKKNGGLSTARNAGINVAAGEYIIFLDSDDYWDDINALSKISSIIEKNNNDVVIWGHKTENEHSDTMLYSTKERLSNEDLITLDNAERLKKIIKTHYHSIGACFKAINRNLFNKYDLYFEEGTVHEDVEWNVRLFACSQNIALYEDFFYVFRQRNDSINNTHSEKNLENRKTQALKMCDTAKSCSNSNMYEAIMLYVSEMYLGIVEVLMRNKMLNRYYSEIKEYCYVLDYTFMHRSRQINILRKIIGLRFALYLRRLVYYD